MAIAEMKASSALAAGSHGIDAAVLDTVRQFLGMESMLLDENRLDEWVGLLDPGFIYEIPIRLAVSRGATDEYPVGAFRVRDDMPMILKRIERTTTSEGWSEDPPSRTVRNFGSIYVEMTDRPGEYRVHSSLIVYRQRAVDKVWDLIPARRQDIIRVSAEECRLCHRVVMLAETILQTPNLGIFL